MATIVEATRTPATREQLETALAAAAPSWSSNERAFAVALMLVETANGQSIIQNNVSNIAAGGFVNGKESLWTTASIWRPSWFEDTTSPLHQKMLDGKAPSAFRAYATLQAGVAAFVALMSKKPAILAAARLGNVADFVAALGAQGGWSPDYGAKHIPTFESLTAGKLSTEVERLGATAADNAGPLLALLLGLSALGGLVYYATRKKRS